MTYQAFCSNCNKKLESTHELGDDFVCTSCYIKVPDDSHYHKGDIDPWAYIKANKLDFFEASVVKYITRWKYKNGLDDLRKAKVYVEELISQAEASQQEPS